jgi:hypothetical protein
MAGHGHGHGGPRSRSRRVRLLGVELGVELGAEVEEAAQQDDAPPEELECRDAPDPWLAYELYIYIYIYLYIYIYIYICNDRPFQVPACTSGEDAEAGKGLWGTCCEAVRAL